MQQGISGQNCPVAGALCMDEIRPHNPKVAGSNPAPAISRKPRKCGVFVFLGT
jgi:hypothetical protein